MRTDERPKRLPLHAKSPTKLTVAEAMSASITLLSVPKRCYLQCQPILTRKTADIGCIVAEQDGRCSHSHRSRSPKLLSPTGSRARSKMVMEATDYQTRPTKPPISIVKNVTAFER